MAALIGIAGAYAADRACRRWGRHPSGDVPCPLALSLTIFGVLLVVQLGEVAVAGAVPDGAGPRLAVLGALVAALALAQVTRSGRRSPPAGTSGAKPRSR
ncbi:MAG TPA: hypothetical protein VMM13_18330 [Euzebya sp.]|nr:hypothetical protein [Euzebya sp.]